MLKILKSKRGDSYIDVAIIVLCAMMVIALAVKVFPIFIAKNQQCLVRQGTIPLATELCREAEISGKVDGETNHRASVLKERLGINPVISWSRTGNIQLNEEVTVTLTLEENLGLFGDFGSFPITLTSKASGKSERYWK